MAYDFTNDKGFLSKISLGINAPVEWVSQSLESPKTPIVTTNYKNADVTIALKAFAEPGDQGKNQNCRIDHAEMTLQNRAGHEITVTPQIRVFGITNCVPGSNERTLMLTTKRLLYSSHAMQTQINHATEEILCLQPVTIKSEGTAAFKITIFNSLQEKINLPDFAVDSKAEEKARDYWKSVSIPYNHFEIPDLSIQNQLDSAIRNIYQSREIKNGLPAFQVGPTCYRGLWVVDGSFIMEAVAYLGRIEEARKGIEYLLSFQKDNGSFMLIDGHWKETGIVLWAVTRHARLSNDKEWLKEQWPKLEKGFEFIKKMRTMPDPQSPNAGMIPDGFSDGGLADKVPEYTNIYWTLAGLKSAAEAARWLDHAEEAVEWQKEYDDFYSTFRKAALRDTHTDTAGNKYVPIRMTKPEEVLPQKAQWAFLHSVFPGKLYEPGDSLVDGNMAMLKACEKEGLVLDTGWLKGGIWNYFASFYGHAWLWLGDGEKAGQVLYDFANHASPLLVWREEQNLLGGKPAFVGDMPHNWASAEFIRLVRHILILERGKELHLLEGLPSAWVQKGKTLKVNQIETDFGPLSIVLKVDKNGQKATVRIEGAKRNPPEKIILHTRGINSKNEVIDITGKKEIIISFGEK